MLFNASRRSALRFWLKPARTIATCARKSKSLGEPFRVTDYQTPDRLIDGKLGVAADRLIISVTETSGGIWVLDHVNR